MNIYSFIGSLLVVLSLPLTAHACSCPSNPRHGELVETSKHIFVAKIKAAALSPDGKWVDATFDAEEVIKGEPAKVPSIRTPFTESNYLLRQGVSMSCPDLQIAPGTRFFVFAKEDMPVLYGHCTPTQILHKRDDSRLPKKHSD
jgi:hypothetical protein